MVGHDHTCVPCGALPSVSISPLPAPVSWILFAHILGFAWFHAFEPQPQRRCSWLYLNLVLYDPLLIPHPSRLGNNLLLTGFAPPLEVQGLGVPTCLQARGCLCAALGLAPGFCVTSGVGAPTWPLHFQLEALSLTSPSQCLSQPSACLCL